MKKLENVIEINCETKDTLKFEELKEFQGGLKARDDSDINKIVKSIKKFGFSFPFFVWKHDGINHLLDGHGRYRALKKLDSLGFIIPALPVVYVNCKDERDARDILLRLNSSYGKMSAESVREFIGDFDIDVENFELPSGTIKFDEELPDIDFGDGESDDEEDSPTTLGVLVSCDSEQELEETFMTLKEMGYNCQMVEE